MSNYIAGYRLTVPSIVFKHYYSIISDVINVQCFLIYTYHIFI